MKIPVNILKNNVELFEAIKDKITYHNEVEMELILEYAGLDSTIWAINQIAGGYLFLKRFKKSCQHIDNRINKAKVESEPEEIINVAGSKYDHKIELSKGKIEVAINRSESIKANETERIEKIYKSMIDKAERYKADQISYINDVQQKSLERIIADELNTQQRWAFKKDIAISNKVISNDFDKLKALKKEKMRFMLEEKRVEQEIIDSQHVYISPNLQALRDRAEQFEPRIERPETND